MISLRKRTIAIVVTAAVAAGCGRSGADAESAQKAPANESPAASSAPARKNACLLIANVKGQIETIAKEKLDMLHDIQADDKTVCELSSAATNTELIYVTVYWRGGKELARINQAAMSMAKQMLNEDDVDIEELTGSEKVRGLADRAYYSDLMPSWVLKGDVLIEVLSPRFGHDQTRAVFLTVAKSALPQL